MPRRKKREYGSGTTFQTNKGQWKASIRYVKPDGKKGRKTLSAKSKRHAEIVLEQLIERYGGQGPTSVFGGTIRELLDRYTRDCTEGLAPATVESNRYARECLGDFENLVLSRIRPVDIMDFLNGLSGKSNTRSKVKNLLYRAFNYAVRLELIDKNPCPEMSGTRQPRRKAQIFEESEIEKILKACRGKPFEPFVLLLAHTGMRQQEAIGLRWKDVSLDGKPFVKIEQVVSEVRGKLHFGEPKTESSKRIVPLTPQVAEILREIPRGKSDELVFQTESGGAMSRNNFGNRVWRPLLKKLKIKPRGMHCLRHTVATQLLLKGAPVTAVAGFLGHKNPSVLLSTYAHFVRGSEQIGAVLMDGFGVAKEEPIREPISPKNTDSGRLKTTEDDYSLTEDD